MRFVFALLLLAGCIDEPCDPGQRFSHGICFIDPVDAGPELEAPDGGASVPIGAICASTAQCGGATNLCAIQPGAPTGFCTHDGCKAQPAVCPEGTICVDLDAFSPGLSICTSGT